MKKYFTLLTIGLAGILSSPSAQASSWQVPNDGFVIQLSTPDGITKKSGQTAEINGTITWVGGHLPESAIGWGNPKYDSKVLSTLLQQDGLQINAYFPDAATNVTSQLKLTYSHDGIDVQYTTPALQSSVPSALTLIVSHQDPIVLALQQTEAKLNVRTTALQTLLTKLTAQGASAKDLAGLKNDIAELQDLSARINKKILASNEILAQQTFPLQVDNLVAGPSTNSSLIEPFRFTVSYDLGSAIAGESTIAHGIILRDPSDREPGGLGSGQWIPRFFWNGAQIKQLAAQKIAPGAQVEFDYPIGPLNPSAQNIFSESLTVSQRDDGGRWNWDSWWTLPNFWNNQSGGALAFTLPVAGDTVAPMLLAGYQPSGDEGYVQAAPTISTTYQDPFGLISTSSIQAQLTGTTASGTPVNTNLTSLLSIVSPDQGETDQIGINLASLSLSDGTYSFSLQLSDLAGNAAIPFVTTFSLDRTPPVIQFGVQNNLQTDQTSFSLPVTIVAESPTTTQISLNGSVAYSATALSFTAPLTLQQGANQITVTATDSAGNTSSNQITITLNTTAPVLASYSPPEGSLISGLSVAVSGKTDQALSSVTVNGTPMTLSSDQESFSGNYTSSAYGPATLTITLTDLAGNVTTHSISVQFVNPNLPILTLSSPSSGILTSATISISGTSSAPLSSLSVNGTPLELSLDATSFSGSYTMPSDGLYNLQITGTDLNGDPISQTVTVYVNQSLSDTLASGASTTVTFGSGASSSGGSSDLGFLNGTINVGFGSGLSGGPSSSACQAADALFSGVSLPTIDSTPYAQAIPPGVTAEIPDPNSVTSFLSPAGDPENALKEGWMVACQGLDIMPPLDCQSQRQYFYALTGEYPEQAILNAIPGMDPTLLAFLTPRFNVCTGFDFSNLSCSDLVSLIPLLSDISVPGLSLIMDTPLSQMVTEEVLCKPLDCSNPLIADTLPTALYCAGISLPPLPNVSWPGISLGGLGDFGGLGGWGSGVNWFSGSGCGLFGCSGSGTTSGSSGGSSSGGSGVAGSTNGCGFFNGPCASTPGSGSVESISCSLFPDLWYCQNGQSSVNISTTSVPSDPGSATVGDILALGTSSNPSLSDVVSSTVGLGSTVDLPGFPDLVPPTLTILTPSQNQSVGSTVQVAGIVSDPTAEVEVNGQAVPVTFGANGGYFSTTISTPSNGTITIQAANAWGIVTSQVVNVIIASPVNAAVVAGGDPDSEGEACVLRPSGNVYCWGSHIGNIPAEVPAGAQGDGEYLSSITSVSFGGQMCALSSSGNVYCWNPGTTDPVEVPGGAQGGVFLSSIVAIGAGTDATCVLSSSGNVYCWGSNTYGQLGNDSTTDSATPVEVVGIAGSGVLSGIVSISGGFEENCATSSSGNVYCWGENQLGQLGINSASGPQVCNAEPCSEAPVEVLGVGVSGVLSDISSTDQAWDGNCALSTEGNVYCWGVNILGNGQWSEQNVPVEVVSGQQTGVGSYLSNITSIAAGNLDACALSSGGNVYCWAVPEDGALGNNDGTDLQASPVQVLSGAQGGGVGLHDIVSIAVETRGDIFFSCAVSSPATGSVVYCWGQGDAGQLGNSMNSSSLVPVTVTPPSTGW